MPHFIDLRSDTVTQPTEAMRKAMWEAEVGDDVYGEDPTVQALQEETAALLGKEAALFVPSGTMANQLALRAHTRHGDEVIAHPNAHIVRAESGASGALAGVQFRMAGSEGGNMNLEQVTPLLQDGSNPHFAPTTLLCLENTHNFEGGNPLNTEATRVVTALAHQQHIQTHLDGARLLNASICLDETPASLVAPFDSTTLCFSKGLGAPVGSVVAGSASFIQRCLRYRKMYGGGMRQAGILAAAARYALQHHIDRLADDHHHAQQLAEGLGNIPHIQLPFGKPRTNMVFFTVDHLKTPPWSEIRAQLQAQGILLGDKAGYGLRAVTHLGIDKQSIEKTLMAFQKAV